MPKSNLIYLGNCIRNARNSCRLTQQELADKCNISVKTIQNIESGKMNPSYEILLSLVRCLGISADTLFYPETETADEDLKYLIGRYYACDPQSRKTLIGTYLALSEQLLS